MPSTANPVAEPRDHPVLAGPQPGRTGGAPRGAVRRAGVLGLFVALAALLFSSTWAHPSGSLVGPEGDNVLFVWMLRWTEFALAHGHNPFFTHQIGFPFGVNLLTTTPVTLAGVALAPVTAVLGPVVAYNVLVTANLALSGWCAYLALRRLVPGWLGPLLGGLLYGFSPYMLAQSLGHAHLTAAFIPPLLLMVLDEILVGQRRSAGTGGLALGLLAVAQLLLASELLVSELLVAAVGTALLAALNPGGVRPRVAHALRALGTAGVVATVLGSGPAAFALFGPGHLPVSAPFRGLGTYVADAANFVVPTSVMALGPAHFSSGITSRWSGGGPEWNAYLGLPLLAMVAWTALRWWSRPLVRLAALLGAITALLSMGPRLHVDGAVTGIPLPWRLVGRLPVLIGMLPNRLALYVDLCAAILLAVFVSHLPIGGLRRKPLRAARARAGWLPALALVAVLATLFPRLPYPAARLGVPRFFSSPSVVDAAIPQQSVALVVPMDTASSLLWQAVAGLRFRMPENDVATGPTRSVTTGLSATLAAAASSGRAPAGPARARAQTRSKLLGELRRARVSTVVLGPVDHEPAVITYLTWLLGRPPRPDAGVQLWADLPTGAP